MDVGGGVEPDARMAVVVVVPGEEPAAVGVGVLEGAEALREVRPVLEGPELALEYGLSLLACGRLWDLVTPRSASRWATGLAIIGDPRSEWMVSSPRPMPCLSMVSAMRASARLARSARASIHPGT